MQQNAKNQHTSKRKREGLFKNFFVKGEYFDYVLENIPEKDKSKIIVIGDSMSSDILGGINSGLDTLWFNPTGEKAVYEPTYTAKNFAELIEILENP